jgi:predicted phage tail protein
MPSATPALKTIRLGGALGREFGRVHRFAVTSPAEAIRALTANYPRFREYMAASDERGVGYRVLVGSDGIGELDHLHAPSGVAHITIAPVIRGAKSGLFTVFAGVALIAASFIPGLNVALAAGLPALSSMVFSVGVAMALGGVAQLLAPHQKSTTTQSTYQFGGVVNTLAAGMPVPICYGNLIVGGAVISAGTVTDQVPTSETGVPGLSATVQETTTGGVSTFQLYASWQPAGNAIGYDVTIKIPGVGVANLARTNGTSVYYTVPGPGPYEVIVNPVESSSTSTIAEGVGTVYGPSATVWSTFLAG